MLDTLWEMDNVENENESGNEAIAQAEAPALTVSADDFSALEERIVRTVEMVKRERQARLDAEERATKAEAMLGEQSPHVEEIEREVQALKAEREQVRKRIERLLAQLDALEV